MIATCLHNTGSALGAPARGGFYSPETRFPLTVGAQYDVHGLGLFGSVLLALVVPDRSERPWWLPVGVFEIPSGPLPHGWEFALWDGFGASGSPVGDTWTAVWGYPELVRSQEHRDGLVEREVDDLRIFYARTAKPED